MVELRMPEKITEQGLWAAAVYGMLVLVSRVFAPYILERLKTEHAQRLQRESEDRAEIEKLRRELMETKMRLQVYEALEASRDTGGTDA